MPFKESPPPNISFWKPDDDFNPDKDRLYVELNWHDDSMVLAWSSDGSAAGGWIIAPEAVPNNLMRHLCDSIDVGGDPLIESRLVVHQSPETSLLIIELAHPMYFAKFVTRGEVCNVRPLRGQNDFYTDELAGYWRVQPVRKRVRA